MSGNSSGYSSQEDRALESITKSQGLDLSAGQDDFIKLLQKHNQQIKYLAANQKQMQKGINDATQNPIQQINQFISDLVVMLGGGELADGLFTYGDLKYILPALGALLGIGSGPFPLNLFEAAAKFFFGYIVPTRQWTDEINTIIDNWAKVFGIDPKFVSDVNKLITSIGDLFGNVENLFSGLGEFFKALDIGAGDLGPLGQALSPIIKLFEGINLQDVGNILEFVTNAIDPFVVQLTAVINFINAVLAVLGFEASGGSGVVNSPLPQLTLPFENLMKFLGNIALNVENFDPVTAAEQFFNNVLGDVPFFTNVSDAITTAQSDIAQLPSEIESDVAAALTGAQNLVTNPVGTIEGWVSSLENLLGIKKNASTGSSGSGSTIATNTTTLQELLDLVGTDTAVSASQLQALAPTSSKNVLSDPSFKTGSYLQGQGLWCWDSWVGAGGFSGPMGCVRTIRPGRITIYNIVGTSQGTFIFIPVFQPPISEPVNYGASGQVFAYFQIPEDDPDLGWLHTANTWSLDKVDQKYFEWINVPYPAAAFPMGESVNAGVQWLINQINQTPGPFFFTMDSQGNQVGSAVYDEIRYGSLQSRRNDFLGAIACGNLRREQGHTFPGCPDPAPGTSGMCVVNAAGSIGPYSGQNDSHNPRGGNLIDTEDLWWDFAVPGDYFACTPLAGDTVVPPADTIGGNAGDIGGIPVILIREFYRFVNFQFAGNPSNLVTDVLQYIQSFANGTIAGYFLGIGEAITIAEDFMGPVYQQINALGEPGSPHMAYYKDYRPLAAKGDNRTFLEIAVDYLNSFIGGSHPDGTPIKSPPVQGTQHQLLGQRVSAQEGDVITAGASVMWVNVACAGPAIAVAVNAYDGPPNDPSANLIGTITYDGCVISDPEPSSNWGFVPLQGDFVMPTGTQSACLVFDVYPDAMTTGIVWFDEAIFETTNRVDGALLNAATLQKITGEQVSGPQGIADMATVVQNLLDGWASANGQTQLTGTQIASAIQSQAQLAAKALLSYQLGVSHNQILTNVSKQSLSTSMQQSGQSTFPLSNGSVPTTSIAAGSSLIGFINSEQDVTIGFIEFEVESASPSGVYVNAYSVDTAAGTLTRIWSSSDVSDQIGTSLSWVGINIASADQFPVKIGDVVALEIVAESSTITVYTETWAHASNSNWTLPNRGASRSTASTGGVSPSSLTNSQISFGGTAPYLCMKVSDLPPNYEPPDETVFSSAGEFPYPIPSWVLPGDLLDVVTVAAGGAAGIYANNRNGQGATAGEWIAKTLEYGTDIPDGTTELAVFIGNGGNAPSGNGGDTIVGYGFSGAPAFDAAGAGDTVVAGSSLSWEHTAAAGAYVIVAVTMSTGTFNVTYGGVTMIPLGRVYYGSYHAVALFGLADVAGGTSTVEVDFWSSTYASGSSLSFTNVSCAGAVSTDTGNGADVSQDVTCGPDQLIVHAFGNQGYGQLSAFSGGTHTYYDSAHVAPYYHEGTSLSYATSGVTFKATASTNDNWGGIAVALNPTGTVLLQAKGGQAGGYGAPAKNKSYNPANTNDSPIGLGPGNKTWAGRPYIGGPNTLTTHLGGNFPGGGSAGGDSGYAPAKGATGAAWITARQGASTISGGGGFSGGGSELSVIYEATGAGDQESTTGVNSLSWTHTSVGGPSCGVVLIGAVEYSSGAASLSATYGSSTFVYEMGGITYYNASGVGLFLFALGIIGPPSGTQTVTLSANGATIDALAANTISYLNIGSFGTFVGNSGIGTALSLDGISSASGQIVVAGFADISKALSGFSQTSRWNQTDTSGIPMLIGDANGDSSVGFGASAAGSDNWGAIGGVLLPPS